MFQIIYDQIMDEMMSLGIVKTIIISQDYYDQLSENERYKLESLLECSTTMKWLITTEKEQFFNFVYCNYKKFN